MANDFVATLFQFQGNNPDLGTSGIPDNCSFDAPIAQTIALLEVFFPDQGEFPAAGVQTEAVDWVASNDAGLIVAEDGDSLLDRFVMFVFYQSTVGDNWVDNSNWLSVMSVCDWTGITCRAQRISYILFSE